MVEVKEPSEGAKQAAAWFRARGREGSIPREDLEEVARGIEDAGVAVQLPPPPEALGLRGWYVVSSKRCNKATCTRCSGGGRHGPYVFYRWRDEAGRVHEEALGPLGKARTPTKGPPPPAPPPAAAPFDGRFLI